MLKIDHFVLKVPDLDTAIAAYEAAGFTVTRGGQHPTFGSINALIPFHDDSYVELIAFPGEMQPGAEDTTSGARVSEWVKREDGLVDWALVPDDIEAEIRRLAAEEVAWHAPLPGQRLRPDGETVRWLFASPFTFALPFLCADVTERTLRVPTGAARVHANGARGVATVTVAVRDMEQAAKEYAVLLQTEATFQANTIVFAWGKIAARAVRLVATEGTERPVKVKLQGWDGELPL